MSAFVLPGAAPPADAQERISDAQIVRYFDLIALRSEYQQIRNPRVTRWDGPIRIHVEQDVAIEPVVMEDLRTHMSRLSRLTAVPMSYVDDARQANYQIVYTRMDRFAHYIERFLGGSSALSRRLIQRAHCVGFYGINRRTGAITQARAVIPVDHARERGVLYACTVEETTQIMGLPNDEPTVLPSIFNDSTIYEDLTPVDELLLRLLYHPRMRPGMPRDEALAIAREVLPSLRAGE